MDVLDEQLHDLVEQLGARPPAPTRVLAAKAQKLHRRRRFARAGVAGTLAVVLVVTAAVVLRSGDGVNRIETPGNEPVQSSTTVPAPQTTVDVPTDVATLSPTFDQQVAQLERWYHNWPAEAPGGRPSLAVESVFCDYRANPDASEQRAGLPVASSVQSRFSSYSKLSEPMTETRLVDGCYFREDRFPDGTPASVPLETSADQLPPYLLCATDQADPNVGGSSTSRSQILKPAVVFGSTDCASAGFQDPPPNLVADLDRRRHVEIELRAVPKDCPTEEEAAEWVRRIAQQELGEDWTVTTALQTGKQVGSTSPPVCYRPHFVDWDSQHVDLLEFQQQQ